MFTRLPQQQSPMLTSVCAVRVCAHQGRVDKHFMLALYHHGAADSITGVGQCDTALSDTLRFPYPFAHNSDEVRFRRS
jgi:hypothetical protein